MTIKTGFLPEPIPTAEVPQAKIEELARRFIDRNYSPNAASPLFKAEKERTFMRLCKDLTVEQAMARYNDVFTEGLEESSLQLSADDIRARAKQIGEEATGGVVEDVLKDTRLFRGWIKAVIASIAHEHFGATVRIALDVVHLDIPAGEGDWSKLVVFVADVWDEDGEESADHTFFKDLQWPGRQVIRTVWVEYIVYLMSVICGFSI